MMKISNTSEELQALPEVRGRLGSDPLALSILNDNKGIRPLLDEGLVSVNLDDLQLELLILYDLLIKLRSDEESKGRRGVSVELDVIDKIVKTKRANKDLRDRTQVNKKLLKDFFSHIMNHLEISVQKHLERSDAKKARILTNAIMSDLWRSFVEPEMNSGRVERTQDPLGTEDVDYSLEFED